MHRPLRDIQRTLADAVRHTPVETLLALLLAGTASAGIADAFSDDVVARALMTGALALVAVFAVSAAHALRVFDTRTRWALTGTVLAVGAVYGIVQLDLDQVTEVWRWAFLGVAATMALVLVPVAARMGDVGPSERFWRYNLRLLSRVAVAYTYAMALYIGLSIALAAVDGLFHLAVGDDVFGHMFVWIVLALGTVLAAGGLSEVRRIGEPFGAQTLVWNGRAGTFLFMPLVLVYLGIMYAYMARVLATGEIPSNILSPLALGAGILGYLGLFLLQPQMHRDDFKPLARVMRAFPVAFVPVVPLGLWAVWQRVDQYGWTEFRYARMAALLCLLAFSLAGAYRWVRRQEFSLVTGPAILGAAALIAAVGPFSAAEVSLRSQQERLRDALQDAELLDTNGQMVRPDQMPESGEVHETIYQTARYLLQTHGAAGLAELTPARLGEHPHVDDQLAALGIRGPVPATRYISLAPRTPRLYELPRGGWVAEFDAYPQMAWRADDGLGVRIEGDRITIDHPRIAGTARIAINGLRERAVEGTYTPTDAERDLDIVDARGVVVGRLMLANANFNVTHGEIELTYVSGLLHAFDQP